ncbi:hypothetical protein GCM10011390_11600 [Aureimonas endophytica]|uniref:DUF4164 family protein n=1 Tax=Aureimonas endophytica TaxID=2027858 RepID=A0A916ZFR8_9HYPH|nr:DUF4164 domain-containing protein [Aureimonas endophytica]GGD94529.1 hypothetical protein GCM10011390_11600 [Aureimonas endophytica]
MPSDTPLQKASARLEASLRRLEAAIDVQSEREVVVSGVEEEIQRMTADRGRLAGDLDAALVRAERLEHTNREVSRRLVSAMETIRSVLERRKEG